MEIKKDALNHFKALHNAVESLDGEAFLSVRTFVVEVRWGNRVYRLFPQFAALHDGRRVYTPQISKAAYCFAGWKPVLMRRPPELGKKLVFKRMVASQGFTTPRFSTSGSDDVGAFIVKRDISSFGADIEGPFRNAPGRLPDSVQGEYFEEFIEGRIVKIWYWKSRPVCLEIKDMPSVTGDGRSTIEELATKRFRRRKGTWEREPVKQVLTYYGRTLESVLGVGERQIIDFRYASVFHDPREVEEIALPSTETCFEPLERLGGLLFDALSESEPKSVCYTVDAILGNDDKLWFLEANFNPFVHPRVYKPMLKSLQKSEVFKELRFAPV